MSQQDDFRRPLALVHGGSAHLAAAADRGPAAFDRWLEAEHFPDAVELLRVPFVAGKQPALVVECRQGLRGPGQHVCQRWLLGGEWSRPDRREQQDDRNSTPRDSPPTFTEPPDSGGRPTSSRAARKARGTCG